MSRSCVVSAKLKTEREIRYSHSRPSIWVLSIWLLSIRSWEVWLIFDHMTRRVLNFRHWYHHWWYGRVWAYFPSRQWIRHVLCLSHILIGRCSMHGLQDKFDSFSSSLGHRFTNTLATWVPIHLRIFHIPQNAMESTYTRCIVRVRKRLSDVRGHLLDQVCLDLDHRWFDHFSHVFDVPLRVVVLLGLGLSLGFRRWRRGFLSFRGRFRCSCLRSWRFQRPGVIARSLQDVWRRKCNRTVL